MTLTEEKKNYRLVDIKRKTTTSYESNQQDDREPFVLVTENKSTETGMEK
jgi:hypothetical protein